MRQKIISQGNPTHDEMKEKGKEKETHPNNMPRSSPDWSHSISFTSSSSSLSSSSSSSSSPSPSSFLSITSSSFFSSSSGPLHTQSQARTDQRTRFIFTRTKTTSPPLRLKRWISAYLHPRLHTSTSPNNKRYYNPNAIKPPATDSSPSQPSSRTMVPVLQGQGQGQGQGQEQEQVGGPGRAGQGSRDHARDASPTELDLRFAGFDYDYEYEQYMKGLEYESEAEHGHHHQSRNPNQPEIYNEDHDGEDGGDEDLILSDNYAAYCRAFTSSPTSPFNNIPVLPLPRFPSFAETGAEPESVFGNDNQDQNQVQGQGQDQIQGSSTVNCLDMNRDLDSAQDASQIGFLPIGAHGYQPASWVAPNPNPPSPPPGILTPARYEEIQQRRMIEMLRGDQKRKQGPLWCIPIRTSWWPWPRDGAKQP
ncbi:hypothetical protein BDV18DRAFT_128209 [Aspergillus unguis]